MMDDWLLQVEVQLLAVTDIKRKKPWPRCGWIGQSNESIILIDKKRCSILFVKDGRTKKKIKGVDGYVKRSHTITVSRNGIYLCGLTTAGEVYLWNKDTDELRTIEGPADFTITHGSRATGKWVIQPSDDGSKVIVLVGYDNVYMWHTLGAAPGGATGAAVVTTKAGRHGKMAGAWHRVRPHLWSTVNDGPSQPQSAACKETSVACSFFCDSVFGEGAVCAYTYSGGASDGSLGQVVIKVLLLSWQHGAGGMHGRAGVSAEVLLTRVRSADISSSFQPLTARGAYVSCMSRGGHVLAVAANQLKARDAAIIFLSPRNGATTVTNLNCLGFAPSKQGRDYWVHDMQWTANDLLLAVITKCGSVALLTRAGPVVAIGIRGNGTDLEPALSHCLLAPACDRLAEQENSRPPLVGSGIGGGAESPTSSTLSETTGRGDSSLTSSLRRQAAHLRQRYSICSHPRLPLVAACDGHRMVVLQLPSVINAATLATTLLRDAESFMNDKPLATIKLSKSVPLIDASQKLNRDRSQQVLGTAAAASLPTLHDQESLLEYGSYEFEKAVPSSLSKMAARIMSGLRSTLGSSLRSRHGRSVSMPSLAAMTASSARRQRTSSAATTTASAASVTGRRLLVHASPAAPSLSAPQAALAIERVHAAWSLLCTESPSHWDLRLEGAATQCARIAAELFARQMPGEQLRRRGRAARRGVLEAARSCATRLLDMALLDGSGWHVLPACLLLVQLVVRVLLVDATDSAGASMTSSELTARSGLTHVGLALLRHAERTLNGVYSQFPAYSGSRKQLFEQMWHPAQASAAVSLAVPVQSCGNSDTVPVSASRPRTNIHGDQPAAVLSEAEALPTDGHQGFLEHARELELHWWSMPSVRLSHLWLKLAWRYGRLYESCAEANGRAGSRGRGRLQGSLRAALAYTNVRLQSLQLLLVPMTAAEKRITSGVCSHADDVLAGLMLYLEGACAAGISRWQQIGLEGLSPTQDRVDYDEEGRGRRRQCRPGSSVIARTKAVEYSLLATLFARLQFADLGGALEFVESVCERAIRATNGTGAAEGRACTMAEASAAAAAVTLKYLGGSRVARRAQRSRRAGARWTAMPEAAASLSVLRSMARFMAMFFTSDTSACLFVPSPHAPAPLPGIFDSWEAGHAIVPVHRPAINEMVKIHGVGHIWTADMTLRLLLASGLFSEAIWFCWEVGDWKMSLYLSLATDAYPWLARARVTATEAENETASGWPLLRSVQPKFLILALMRRLLSLTVDADGHAAAKDSRSVMRTDVIDPLLINDTASMDVAASSIRELLLPAAVCSVSVVGDLLWHLVDELKAALCSLPLLVPDDVYLPAPPMFCPQPESFLAGTQPPTGGIAAAAATGSAADEEFDVFGGSAGSACELAVRATAARLTMLFTVVLRASRTELPAAVAVLERLSRTLATALQLGYRDPPQLTSQLARLRAAGRGLHVCDCSQERRRRRGSALGADCSSTRGRTDGGRSRAGGGMEESEPPVVADDCAAIELALRELIAVQWMFHVRDKLTASLRRGSALQRNRWKQTSPKKNKAYLLEWRSEAKESLLWCTRLLPFGRFLGHQNRIREMIISLVMEQPPGGGDTWFADILAECTWDVDDTAAEVHEKLRAVLSEWQHRPHRHRHGVADDFNGAATAATDGDDEATRDSSDAANVSSLKMYYFEKCKVAERTNMQRLNCQFEPHVFATAAGSSSSKQMSYGDPEQPLSADSKEPSAIQVVKAWPLEFDNEYIELLDVALPVLCSLRIDDVGESNVGLPLLSCYASQLTKTFIPGGGGTDSSSHHYYASKVPAFLADEMLHDKEQAAAAGVGGALDNSALRTSALTRTQPNNKQPRTRGLFGLRKHQDRLTDISVDTSSTLAPFRTRTGNTAPHLAFVDELLSQPVVDLLGRNKRPDSGDFCALLRWLNRWASSPSFRRPAVHQPGDGSAVAIALLARPAIKLHASAAAMLSACAMEMARQRDAACAPAAATLTAGQDLSSEQGRAGEASERLKAVAAASAAAPGEADVAEISRSTFDGVRSAGASVTGAASLVGKQLSVSAANQPATGRQGMRFEMPATSVGGTLHSKSIARHLSSDASTVSVTSSLVSVSPDSDVSSGHEADEDADAVAAELMRGVAMLPLATLSDMSDGTLTDAFTATAFRRSTGAANTVQTDVNLSSESMFLRSGSAATTLWSSVTLPNMSSATSTGVTVEEAGTVAPADTKLPASDLATLPPVRTNGLDLPSAGQPGRAAADSLVKSAAGATAAAAAAERAGAVTAGRTSISMPATVTSAAEPGGRSAGDAPAGSARSSPLQAMQPTEKPAVAASTVKHTVNAGFDDDTLKLQDIFRQEVMRIVQMQQQNLLVVVEALSQAAAPALGTAAQRDLVASTGGSAVRSQHITVGSLDVGGSGATLKDDRMTLSELAGPETVLNDRGSITGHLPLLRLPESGAAHVAGQATDGRRAMTIMQRFTGTGAAPAAPPVAVGDTSKLARRENVSVTSRPPVDKIRTDDSTDGALSYPAPAPARIPLLRLSDAKQVQAGVLESSLPSLEGGRQQELHSAAELVRQQRKQALRAAAVMHLLEKREARREAVPRLLAGANTASAAGLGRSYVTTDTAGIMLPAGTLLRLPAAGTHAAEQSDLARPLDSNDTARATLASAAAEANTGPGAKNFAVQQQQQQQKPSYGRKRAQRRLANANALALGKPKAAVSSTQHGTFVEASLGQPGVQRQENVAATIEHGYVLTPGLMDSFLDKNMELGSAADTYASLQYRASVAIHPPPLVKRDMGVMTDTSSEQAQPPAAANVTVQVSSPTKEKPSQSAVASAVVASEGEIVGDVAESGRPALLQPSSDAALVSSMLTAINWPVFGDALSRGVAGGILSPDIVLGLRFASWRGRDGEPGNAVAGRTTDDPVTRSFVSIVDIDAAPLANLRRVPPTEAAAAAVGSSTSADNRQAPAGRTSGPLSAFGSSPTDAAVAVDISAAGPLAQGQDTFASIQYAAATGVTASATGVTASASNFGKVALSAGAVSPSWARVVDAVERNISREVEPSAQGKAAPDWHQSPEPRAEPGRSTFGTMEDEEPTGASEAELVMPPLRLMMADWLRARPLVDDQRFTDRQAQQSMRQRSRQAAAEHLHAMSEQLSALQNVADAIRGDYTQAQALVRTAETVAAVTHPAAQHASLGSAARMLIDDLKNQHRQPDRQRHVVPPSSAEGVPATAAAATSTVDLERMTGDDGMCDTGSNQGRLTRSAEASHPCPSLAAADQQKLSSGHLGKSVSWSDVVPREAEDAIDVDDLSTPESSSEASLPTSTTARRNEGLSSVYDILDELVEDGMLHPSTVDFSATGSTYERSEELESVSAVLRTARSAARHDDDRGRRRAADDAPGMADARRPAHATTLTLTAKAASVPHGSAHLGVQVSTAAGSAAAAGQHGARQRAAAAADAGWRRGERTAVTSVSYVELVAPVAADPGRRQQAANAAGMLPSADDRGHDDGPATQPVAAVRKLDKRTKARLNMQRQFHEERLRDASRLMGTMLQDKTPAVFSDVGRTHMLFAHKPMQEPSTVADSTFSAHIAGASATEPGVNSGLQWPLMSDDRPTDTGISHDGVGASDTDADRRLRKARMIKKMLDEMLNTHSAATAGNVGALRRSSGQPKASRKSLRVSAELRAQQRLYGTKRIPGTYVPYQRKSPRQLQVERQGQLQKATQSTPRSASQLNKPTPSRTMKDVTRRGLSPHAAPHKAVTYAEQLQQISAKSPRVARRGVAYARKPEADLKHTGTASRQPLGGGAARSMPLQPQPSAGAPAPSSAAATGTGVAARLGEIGRQSIDSSLLSSWSVDDDVQRILGAYNEENMPVVGLMGVDGHDSARSKSAWSDSNGSMGGASSYIDWDDVDRLISGVGGTGSRRSLADDSEFSQTESNLGS